jgi:3-oxoacyl-(acyl-carrier-protein) synthase
MRDVVVTGYAVVAPAAMDAHSLFERIASGRSCIRAHPEFGQLGFPNPAAGFIDAGQWRAIDAAAQACLHTVSNDPQPASPATADSHPRMTLLRHVTRHALAHAGLDWTARHAASAGLFIGANKFCADLDGLAACARATGPDRRLDLDALLADPEFVIHPHSFRVDQQTVSLAAELGLARGAVTHSDACAAGTMAIGSGFRAVRDGRTDIAICGAVELLANALPYFMFHSLGAMGGQPGLPPEQQSRPFTRQRDGLVLGEGAAIVVLESASHAGRRGGRARARVLGHANRCEAQKITASDADGRHYAECMQAALDDAGLGPAEIDHINAHGTSTRLNDACEAAAIRRLFGSRLPALTLTANKSALGHSLAASGAIEAVLAIIGIERGEVLPTLNHSAEAAEYPDLGLSDRPRRQAMQAVLSNSFGFGGQNSSLVMAAA